MIPDLITLILAILILFLFLFHLRRFPDYRGFWIRIGDQASQIIANDYITITVDKPLDTPTNGLFILEDPKESEQS